MDKTGGSVMEPEMLLWRAQALQYVCPYCGAVIDQRCWNPKTGIELGKQAAHLQRVWAVTDGT
jgi:hypothetical protein